MLNWKLQGELVPQWNLLTLIQLGYQHTIRTISYHISIYFNNCNIQFFIHYFLIAYQYVLFIKSVHTILTYSIYHHPSFLPHLLHWMAKIMDKWWIIMEYSYHHVYIYWLWLKKKKVWRLPSGKLTDITARPSFLIFHLSSIDIPFIIIYPSFCHLISSRWWSNPFPRWRRSLGGRRHCGPPQRTLPDAGRVRTGGGTSGRGSDCGGGGFLGEKSAGNVGKNDGNVGKTMQNMEKSLDMWKKSSEN